MIDYDHEMYRFETMGHRKYVKRIGRLRNRDKLDAAMRFGVNEANAEVQMAVSNRVAKLEHDRQAIREMVSARDVQQINLREAARTPAGSVRGGSVVPSTNIDDIFTNIFTIPERDTQVRRKNEIFYTEYEIEVGKRKAHFFEDGLTYILLDDDYEVCGHGSKRRMLKHIINVKEKELSYGERGIKRYFCLVVDTDIFESQILPEGVSSAVSLLYRLKPEARRFFVQVYPEKEFKVGAKKKVGRVIRAKKKRT